jgi:putative hydrolase of the HAD superfamily
MPFDLAVIDLDNTLYAADSGVFARMDKRMTAFVAGELGVDHKEADRLRVKYWKEYGTTLRGMMLHHGMEPEAFLHNVHDINAHEILSEDSELDRALARLPGRKVIHTNGIREHAERILEALGVLHHFERIYDIRFNNYIPKPCKETLAMLIEAEGSTPERTLVVDDMADNLAVATELGCKTVWISHAAKKGTWDYHLPSFHHLPGKFEQNQ